MDALGLSRWMQGRFKEALKLHEDAIKGLSKLHGDCHESLARAKDHLGRVHTKYFRHEEARQLHEEAVAIFCKTKGPNHLDTMEALENLASTYRDIGDPYLDKADEMMRKVLETRKAKLGKEHLLTLWAQLSLARLKAVRGDLEEAEDDIRRGLLVAYRNLGADHIGVLMARMYLGDVLYSRERFHDADDELRDVIDRQKRMSSSRHNTHADCIMAMYLRANCLKALLRHEEAINLCEEASQALRDMGGHEHPLATKIEERRQEIADARLAATRHDKLV